jgi:hypothetical protein
MCGRLPGGFNHKFLRLQGRFIYLKRTHARR